jgi:hypothetical protein
VSIRGKAPDEDVVLDRDLQMGSQLQSAVWEMERRLHDFMDRLEARIAAGARVESEEYYFDRQRKMVRSTNAKRAGNE